MKIEDKIDQLLEDYTRMHYSNSGLSKDIQLHVKTELIALIEKPQVERDWLVEEVIENRSRYIGAPEKMLRDALIDQLRELHE